MNNHYYTFDYNIGKQSKGGAIGNESTKRVGKMCIKRHDKKYTKLLAKLKVEHELFERYFDDETESLAAFDPGVRFNGKRLVMKEKLVEEDNMVSEDKKKRTMNILKDIGNTILKCVQFTVDCPSMNPKNKKVPVFDLQVHVEDNKIINEFYEKSVACTFFIP